MIKITLLFLLALATGCHHSGGNDHLVAIQIQDRNGLTETVNNQERLALYESHDFLTSQPYKKVLRFYKQEGKNHSKITTYHPSGMVWQYLEAEEMRAHGAYREWFPNGSLKIEALVIGGTADISPGAQQDWLFDGASYVWDEQGRKLAEIVYEKGLLEGPSVYFYPTGQVERTMYFSKNKLNGSVLEFTLQGELISKTEFKEGTKEGESIHYFDSGQMAWSEEYSEGLLTQGTYYNPKGDLISEVKNGLGKRAVFENKALTLFEFQNGKAEGIVKKFTPANELKQTYYLKNGVKVGEEIEYYLASENVDSKKNPLPKLSVPWSDNRIHGSVKTWYNSGQLQSQRDYCRNKKQGSSLAWYRDGALMMVEEYEEDLLMRGQYFKKTHKEPISSIFNGNGVATLFDEEGIFLRKIHYSKGKPIDPEN